jgi:hypothetical protein
MEDYSVIKRAGLYLAAGVVGLTSLVGCSDSKDGGFSDAFDPMPAFSHVSQGLHSTGSFDYFSEESKTTKEKAEVESRERSEKLDR